MAYSQFLIMSPNQESRYVLSTYEPSHAYIMILTIFKMCLINYLYEQVDLQDLFQRLTFDKVCLLVYLHVETKILQEMKENLPEINDQNRGVLGAGEVSKLVYLHAAICEIPRLYPSVSINHKNAAQSEMLPSGHLKTYRVKTA